MRGYPNDAVAQFCQTTLNVNFERERADAVKEIAGEINRAFLAVKRPLSCDSPLLTEIPERTHREKQILFPLYNVQHVCCIGPCWNCSTGLWQ